MSMKWLEPAELKPEGMPLHPDSIPWQLTPQEYQEQLKAHEDWKKKNVQ